MERPLKKVFSRSGIRDVDWIDPAQDRERWRELVNVVMSPCVPLKMGISGLAEDLLVSQKGLCYMELGS